MPLKLYLPITLSKISNAKATFLLLGHVEKAHTVSIRQKKNYDELNY